MLHQNLIRPNPSSNMARFLDDLASEVTPASIPQADGAEIERQLETSRQSGRVITPADIRRTLREAGIACTTPDPRTARIRNREAH